MIVTLTEPQALNLVLVAMGGVFLIVAIMIVAFARWSVRDRRKREADLREAREEGQSKIDSEWQR